MSGHFATEIRELQCHSLCEHLFLERHKVMLLQQIGHQQEAKGLAHQAKLKEPMSLLVTVMEHG